MGDADGAGKSGDPTSARREQLREVVALLTKIAKPGDQMLVDARAELAALNAQRPPAARLLALQRRNANLQN